MAILTRVLQLFKADIHGVMDQIEDQKLMLKQHLRDMEETLNHKEAAFRQMCFARDQARQEYEKAATEINNLQRDLRIAIQKNRDDIARMLIKKLKRLMRIQAERGSHIDLLNQETEAFKETIEQQRLQYELLRQQASAFFYRTERQGGYYCGSVIPLSPGVDDLSPEEIELELLQRKEALKGGTAS